MNPPPESEHPEPPNDGESAPSPLENDESVPLWHGQPTWMESEPSPPTDFECIAAPEGEYGAAAPEFERVVPTGEEHAQPPEYEYLAPIEEGHPLPTSFEAGYALPSEPVTEPVSAPYEPTSDEARYAPGAMVEADPTPAQDYSPPMVPDDQVALLCEGLERFLGAAEARVHVLRGVSLRLEPGFVHAVVGPSGCGKSSLLYILGLLDRPDAGRLVISGRPVANLDDDDLSRQRSALLGFIFQFHFLLQDFSALENVMIPMRQLGALSESQMRERAAHLLDAVGLADKGHRASRHLSGGEQQRVAIARALANDPQVILADEPTGNLDTANSTRVFSLLTDLVHRENKALLLVTHNPAIAEACDWVHTMRDGLIVDQQYIGTRR